MGKQTVRDLGIGILASILGSLIWEVTQSIINQNLTNITIGNILRFMLDNIVPMFFMCIAVIAYIRAGKFTPKEKNGDNIPKEFLFELEILKFIVKQRGQMLYSVTSGGLNFGDGRPRPGMRECYAEELRLLQAKYGEDKMTEIKKILKNISLFV